MRQTKKPTNIDQGVILLSKLGTLETGDWILHSGSKCIILEMPDHDPETEPITHS
mgnify:CR=1 FL=1